jgi:predicted metal-binding protein
VTTENDRQLLQVDLDMLQEWVAENRLVLSVNKCNVVSFTRKDKVTCPPEYTIMGQVLEEVKEYKYILGGHA